MGTLNAGVSDLFFNHEKLELERLYEAADGEGVPQEDEDAAILTAATDYAGMIDSAIGVEIEPRDLVEDFKRRL